MLRFFFFSSSTIQTLPYPEKIDKWIFAKSHGTRALVPFKLNERTRVAFKLEAFKNLTPTRQKFDPLSLETSLLDPSFPEEDAG